jgi:hypothetical protein
MWINMIAWMTQHDEIATHGLILAILTLVACKKNMTMTEINVMYHINETW